MVLVVLVELLVLWFGGVSGDCCAVVLVVLTLVEYLVLVDLLVWYSRC